MNTPTEKPQTVWERHFQSLMMVIVLAAISWVGVTLIQVEVDLVELRIDLTELKGRVDGYDPLYEAREELWHDRIVGNENRLQQLEDQVDELRMCSSANSP